MRHPLRCVLPVLMATLGGARGVQAQSVDVGTHVGVREDGRRFLGAQLAVAVAPEIRLNGGVLSVRDVGADASLAEVELSVRWATTITRSVRPYLISGLVLERSRVSNVKSTKAKRTSDGMRVEYDFSGGVRGKYAARYPAYSGHREQVDRHRDHLDRCS